MLKIIKSFFRHKDLLRVLLSICCTKIAAYYVVYKNYDIMKRIVLVFAFLFSVAVAVAADDKPVTREQLPLAAREFMDKYFAGIKPTLIMRDDDVMYKDYEVVLSDGTRIDFSSLGEWQEITVRNGSVPAALIPEGVTHYLSQHYPDVDARRVDRGRRSFEVELSNGFELTFDKHGRLIDIDD
jgi:hypothetical protein